MVIEWVKGTFFGKKSESNKTKNPRLLGLWNEFQKRPFPDFDTKSEKLSDMISDLALPDSYIAGYIHTYIFYGRYNDERKDFDPREGIKSEINGLIKSLSDFKKIKYPAEDSEKYRAAIDYINETIRIAKLVLKEKR